MNPAFRNEATQNRLKQFFADTPGEVLDAVTWEYPASPRYVSFTWDSAKFDSLSDQMVLGAEGTLADDKPYRHYDGTQSRWLSQESLEGVDAGQDNLFPYPSI